MTTEGHKIREMADRLCRGKRYESADRHLQAMKDVSTVIGYEMKGNSFYDFLAGWDAAMETKCEELAEENVKLHGIITELCMKLHIESPPSGD